MLDVWDFHISITDEDGIEVDRQRMIYFQATVRDKNDIEILRNKLKQEFPDIITLHPVNYPDIVVYFLTGVILIGNFIIFFLCLTVSVALFM